MVVRGRFAVPTQMLRVSLVFKYSNKMYMQLDSRRIMLYYDIDCGNVENEMGL